MKLIFFLFILLLGGVCLLLQDMLPVFKNLQYASILLLPMLMFVAASMVSFPAMLFFAAVFGVAWDLSELVILPNGSSLGLGVSMFLFALFGSIMQGVRPLFFQGRWETPLLFSGFTFFLYLLFSYLAINLRQGDIHFPQGLWLKIGLTTLMTTLFSPMFFYLLYRIASWCNVSLEGSR